MLCLAIDTSTSACSACVYDANADAILACKSEEIGKGHAERLIDLINETLTEAELAYGDLQRIVTSIGPGSFTGARVSVSAARGFGLSLKIPVVGASNFDATLSLCSNALGSNRSLLALVSAGRDQFFGQSNVASKFAKANQPFVCQSETLITSDLMKTKDLVLCGTHSFEILAEDDSSLERFEASNIEIVEELARLGAKAVPSIKRPEPLYLRQPDAKPQTKFAIERVS